MNISNNKENYLNSLDRDIYIVPPKLSKLSTGYSKTTTYNNEEYLIATTYEESITPLIIEENAIFIDTQLDYSKYIYIEFDNIFCIQPIKAETINNNTKLSFNIDITDFSSFKLIYGYIYYKEPSSYISLLKINQVYKNQIVCNNIGIPITVTELGLLPNTETLFNNKIISNRQFNIIKENTYIYGNTYTRKCAMLETEPEIVISKNGNKYIYLEQNLEDEIPIDISVYYYEVRNDLFTDYNLTILQEYLIEITTSYSKTKVGKSILRTEFSNNRSIFGNIKEQISLSVPNRLPLSANIPYKKMEVFNV